VAYALHGRDRSQTPVMRNPMSLLHLGAELLREDIATVVVENRAEVKPARAEQLDGCEFSWPTLVDGCRLVFELTRGLEHDER